MSKSRKRRPLKPTYKETNTNGPAPKRQKVSYHQYDSVKTKGNRQTDASSSSSHNNRNSSTFTTNAISHPIQNDTNIDFNNLYQSTLNNNNNTNNISTSLTSVNDQQRDSTANSTSYMDVIKSQLGDSGASDVMSYYITPEVEVSLKETNYIPK